VNCFKEFLFLKFSVKFFCCSIQLSTVCIYTLLFWCAYFGIEWEWNNPMGIYTSWCISISAISSFFRYISVLGSVRYIKLAICRLLSALYSVWLTVRNQHSGNVKNWKLNQIVHKSGNKRRPTQKPSNLTSKRYCFLETFSVWAIVSYRLVWRCVYLHCEAAKRGQYYFACFSFNTRQKLVNFFMYIKERISYNSVYLIFTWDKNFAATETLNVLCLPVK